MFYLCSNYHIISITNIGWYSGYKSYLVQMKGEAEAFAVEAKAKAEAEQMARKADAWKQYEDAAVVDMVLDMLPKVSTSVFKVLKIVFYNIDDDDDCYCC